MVELVDTRDSKSRFCEEVRVRFPPWAPLTNIDMMALLDSLYNLLITMVDTMGYLGVFFLMIIESSFIPFPSEAVIIPAAGLAAGGEMNILLVVLFGTLGSVVGALVNYFLGKYLGKPLVYTLVQSKWAKFLLLNEKKVHRAEKYFLKYGKASTFLGRLVPGIRQLISLPAGFVSMNLAHFMIYTALGAGVWVSVLAYLGYEFGGHLEGGEILVWVGMIVVLMLGGYAVFMKMAEKRHQDDEK